MSCHLAVTITLLLTACSSFKGAGNYMAKATADGIIEDSRPLKRAHKLIAQNSDQIDQNHDKITNLRLEAKYTVANLDDMGETVGSSITNIERRIDSIYALLMKLSKEKDDDSKKHYTFDYGPAVKRMRQSMGDLISGKRGRKKGKRDRVDPHILN